MNKEAELRILIRIRRALAASRNALQDFTSGSIHADYKEGHDPVTEADRKVDEVLRQTLPLDGEGWLSEESRDSSDRLKCERLWVVDPLDGTREFIAGIPEWCVSIAYVENGSAIAGGICNPATGEMFVGSKNTGVLRNGLPTRTTTKEGLRDALILASRSEVNRGEWTAFENDVYRVQAMGSVAYKLARVAAGLADATFTLVPKHEWDVAAGVALVEAAGGCALNLDGGAVTFNRPSPKMSGLMACGAGLAVELLSMLTSAKAAA